MIKNISLLVLAVLAVVFASGCTFDVGNQTYNANGISFTYPMGWSELSSDKVNMPSGSAPVIAAVASDNSIQNDVYQVLAVVQSTSTIATLSEAASQTKSSITANGQISSEKDVTISGQSGKQLIYTIGTKKERMVIWVQNGQAYSITCSAPPADFDAQQANFDMIINSLQVK